MPRTCKVAASRKADKAATADTTSPTCFDSGPPPRRRRASPSANNLRQVFEEHRPDRLEQEKGRRPSGGQRTLALLAPSPRLDYNEEQQWYLDGIPIKEYLIEGRNYTMQVASHERESVVSRRTRDGQLITYELHVAQQPMRARACGSGPRSASDRRPVDPPPVIQLRVFLGEHREKDVTMEYDSTFVLYASLEVARPIAHGRLFTGATPPVLTGVPVAGCAYLDKPQKAAYFIFPDLSVRHEGWYNLRFCLFERVKVAKDGDSSPAGFPPTGPDISEMEGMANRMEVRTSKFQVYSAKKFPGLESSTHLSKEMAEQGCRVRIRREVRQRKRVAKPDDYDDAAEPPTGESPDTIYSTAQTPLVDHRRSISRSSFHGSQYGPTDIYRRFSIDNQAPAPPQGMQSAMTASSPLVQNPVLPQPQQSPMMPPPSNSSAFAMGPPAAASEHRASTTGTYTGASSSILPPIAALRTPPGGPSESATTTTTTAAPEAGSPFFDMETRQWNFPSVGQLTGSKRSLSPKASSQITRLVDGARPSDVVPQHSSAASSMAISGFIEAADSADESDGSDDLCPNGRFDYNYVRADGSRGTKVLEYMNRGFL